MKKTILSVMVGAALLTGASACAKIVKVNRNYVTRTVELPAFTGITAGNTVDVVYSQTTGAQSIEIYAPDDEIDRITVEVRDGMLHVGMKDLNRRIIGGPVKREVRVSAPAVNYLEATSSSDIKLNSGLRAEGDVTISANSSGDVIGNNVTCTGNMTLSSSSSGDVKLRDVRCNTLLAKANSSGDVKINALSCTDLSAYASSSGDVVVGMLDAQNVVADASSSGDVKLSGSCVNANLRASSSGDVKAAGLTVVNLTKNESSSGSVSCNSGH